jgi:glycosyltransferase involved in cell wall biosynthesis
MRVAIVQTKPHLESETFVRAHADRLPAEVVVVHGQPPAIDGRRLIEASPRGLWPLLRGLARGLRPHAGWRALAISSGYLAALRRIRPDVVLAEFGPSGAAAREACVAAEIPLVTFFHGYDATRRSVTARYRDDYLALFRDGAALIAPSRSLARELVALGADAERIQIIPYGVDLERFSGGDPASAPPLLLAVGRFVEKKAPHLLLLSFARLRESHPEVELRLIGDGPLLPVCRDLARALGLAHHTHFLGAQAPEVVAEEMRRARALVQHSAEADDGDCEGAPVALIEAAATGIPVVSTRHAGIPEIVLDGKTGLLVGEREVEGFARRMAELVRSPEQAAALGAAAREHAERHFGLARHIERLAAVLRGARDGRHAGGAIFGADADVAARS